MDRAFVELSEALTGYPQVDLFGTGLVEFNWATLLEQAGEAPANELLAAWERAKQAGDLDEGLRTEILSDPSLGPIARNLIRLWYLGQWGYQPGDTFIPSGESYVQGLVWNAIGAHPMAAKQQGFGSWSLPPSEVDGVSR